MPTQTIHTELKLSGTAADAWHILTNFSHYPDWNQVIPSIVGQPQLGSTIKVSLAVLPPLPITFKARIVTLEDQHKLVWEGPEGPAKRLFWGRHSLILNHKPGSNTVTLTNEETFGGWLSGIVLFFLRRKTTQRYQGMNAALNALLQHHRQHATPKALPLTVGASQVFEPSHI